MDEGQEFVESFLAHKGASKEEIAAYNRQYYLKNRKLKGRSKSTKVTSRVYDTTPRYSGPPASEQEKVRRIQDRLLKVRKAARKKKGNKAQKLEQRLNRIEQKLQKKLKQKVNRNLPASFKRAQKRAEDNRKQRLARDRAAAKQKQDRIRAASKKATRR